MKNKIKALNAKISEAKKGGGDKRIEAQHKKGKLTARERYPCGLKPKGHLPDLHLTGYPFLPNLIAGNLLVGSRMRHNPLKWFLIDRRNQILFQQEVIQNLILHGL